MLVLVERSRIAPTNSTCWCTGVKPVSYISPLTASRWASSRGSRMVPSDDRTPPTKSRDTLMLWSSDKWKTLYLHFHKASGSQILQSGDLGWGNPTHKVRWYMNYVVTWEFKDVLAPLSKGLWTPNLADWWLRMRDPHPQSHVVHEPRGHVTNQRCYISTFSSPADRKLSRILVIVWLLQ